jgi:hypothetical protein
LSSHEVQSGDPFDLNDDEATLDQLQDDVEGPSSAVRREVSARGTRAVVRGSTPANRVKHAEADKAEQSNTLREKFFYAATGGTGALLAVNVVLFAAYMKSEWNHIADSVMLAWISATVVEVLGIVYIIAKYLFGDPEKKQ